MSNKETIEIAKEDDEILDLVDEHDQVIGTIPRSETAGGKHEGFLRAAELLIINSKGQLWIPRRQMHKRIAPGGLDFSAGGHVSSGDGYKGTLLREVEEELNLKLEDTKLEFMHKFPPEPGFPPYFREVYLYHTDEVPDYNPDDFSEYHWMSPQELIDKIKSGDTAKKNLAPTAEFLLARKK